MRSTRNVSSALIAAVALVFAFSTISLAKTNKNFPSINIDNFGQMDDNFFRGGRPKAADLQSLAALGVHTIIDLTDNSRDKEEPAVEAAGMKYVNIPIVDKTNPSAEQIAAFLKIANNPATGKFYVHCAGGRHRTGVMAALYRFNHDHWNYDQVYAEMKQYDFYTSNGHGKQLDFVQAYWQQLQAKQGNVAAAATAGH